MYKIGIVDDEAKIIEQISSFVKTILDGKNESYEIETSASPSAFLEGYKEGYDILFLDVMMGEMDGMSLAQRIRKVDQNVTIVFITLMAKYAINGYEVGAYDYILKPVEYDAFAARFEKILLHASKSKSAGKRITLRSRDSMHILSCREILYVESSAHYLVFHTHDEDFKHRGKLKDIALSLEDARFALCNQCFLVNLQHIASVDDDYVVLDNDEKLAISRLKKKAFLSALSNYYLKA